MYPRISYFFIISLFMVILSLSLSCSNVCAELTVQIMTHPHVESISLGSGPAKIGIAAHTNTPNVKYAWNLKGPGQLDGDPTTPGVIYIPPVALHGKTSDEVIVTVIITDDQGKTAEDRVTFTLTSPVTPTPTPFSEIDQLLRQAERCFRNNELMTPEGNNAFECYQKVLALEPANQQARDGLYAIARKYKEWGDGSYPANFERARTFYERYLTVADYIISAFGDVRMRSAADEVRRRLTARPTPTPTPTPPRIPTATPTPTPMPEVDCPSQTTGLEELLSRALHQDLEQYKDLIHREKQREQLNPQIVAAIERIICDLQAIERILTEHYEQKPDPDVKERIQKTRVTRQQYEEERKQRL